MKSPFLNKIFVFFIVLISSFGLAQNKPMYSEKQIESYIREVFSDQAETLVFTKSSKRHQLINSFFNRISIKNMPELRGKKIKLLSELLLLDKYNSNLKRETVFNPENFNALKYQFNIASKDKQVYRADGTDYIIIVNPLNQ